LDPDIEDEAEEGGFNDDGCLFAEGLSEFLV
jgi:hypothetical protein